MDNNMTTMKKVTLNKAAVMMKRVKALQNENMCINNGAIIYPIDAISGKNPRLIRKQILDKIADTKRIARETKDAIMFYANIKEAIITANVNSGLHLVLCQIDMMKNQKTFLEHMVKSDASKVVQEYAQNSRGLTHILLKENYVNEELVFSTFAKDVVKDITRQDSKTNYVNAVIDIESHSAKEIQKTLNEITKALNVLEDRKYEINNTYKIDVLIPKSLYDVFGIESEDN